MIEHGNYADFEVLENGNLKISLTHEGKTELEEISFNLENNMTDFDMFRDVIDYQLCNGWTWVNPEDIGALTEAPILSNDIEYDDNGMATFVNAIWWYPNYMVDNIIEKLYSDGYLIFTLAE